MARRRDARAFFANLRDHDGSLGEKLRLAVSNNLRKAAGPAPCCGHPGEPGC